MQKGTVVKSILATLAVGGIVAMGAIAPGVPGAILKLVGQSRHRRYYLKKALKRVIDRGLIRFSKSAEGKTYLEITRAGEKELAKYQLGELKLQKPKHWDGKWRVVIFDIREVRRGDRNRLRRELVGFGFMKLQHSVWIYPHDCEELILLLKTHFELGRALLYLVVESLENDRWLQKAFQLKQS